MVYLTREQRVALHRLWLRRACPERKYIKVWKLWFGVPDDGVSYRQFRLGVVGLIGGGGCVMICVEGLWHGIETDGYCHT